MKGEPGSVILFGSGETSSNGRKIWDWLFQRLEPPVRTAILETPAGFEPNSEVVAGRIADFIYHSLQNHKPEAVVVPARKQDTRFSPDNPDILEPMLDTDVLFLGPGSPTYAVRQLEASLAWEIIRARHHRGTAVVLASAAAIAAGAYTLPVYEIYKVGEELHWHTGLDFFARFGLAPTFVPHWNNREGGEDLDTSRCYMGQKRFARLLEMLPSDTTIVGIDEHTALVVDLAGETCRVMGLGGVTLLHQGESRHFPSGATFALDALGTWQMPAPDAGIRPDALELIREAQKDQAAALRPPAKVKTLLERREAARANEDWDTADELRDRITELGWQVQDTRNGSRLEPLEET